MADRKATSDVRVELEKNLVHDAVTGLALAATVAATASSRSENKEAFHAIHNPHHHVLEQSHEGEPSQPQVDPTRPMVAANKAQSLKQKLATIRESIKAPDEKGRSPAAESLHEKHSDSRESLKKQCRNCGFLHKSEDTCWQGGGGRSLNDLKRSR